MKIPNKMRIRNKMRRELTVEGDNNNKLRPKTNNNQTNNNQLRSELIVEEGSFQ